jgi:hypothetical protein
MAFVTGEVIPDPHGSRTYDVVFRRGKEILASWPVSSQQDGEKQIVELLRRLDEQARREGYF